MSAATATKHLARRVHAVQKAGLPALAQARKVGGRSHGGTKLLHERCRHGNEGFAVDTQALQDGGLRGGNGVFFC